MTRLERVAAHVTEGGTGDRPQVRPLVGIQRCDMHLTVARKSSPLPTARCPRGYGIRMSVRPRRRQSTAARPGRRSHARPFTSATLTLPAFSAWPLCMNPPYALGPPLRQGRTARHFCPRNARLHPPSGCGRLFSGGGRESNPPGHFRTLIGFEDRGTHQASGRLQAGRYLTRRRVRSLIRRTASRG